MKVYDKAAWHIDAGENRDEVIKRFSIIFSYLLKNDMLSSEGKEIMDIGVDSSVSLHERMVNESGKNFLDSRCNELLECKLEDLQKKLCSKI